MSLNVLVVDDSSVMRNMIIRTLQLTGLPVGQVFQAANGRDGLTMLDEHWIDLAMVDINMPTMNGEEMIERLRENPSTVDLHVLVVSTESSETRIAKLRSLGAKFIHKPFTPEELGDQLRQMTGVRND
ncbi:MAG TPA: response regulator [Blastocatellia bacterium]|nr:response regulator [Blastocatellia bacterium]